MKPSSYLIPVVSGLLASQSVEAVVPANFAKTYEAASGTTVVVDSALTLEQATHGNHCEGDVRFATVKARQQLVDVLYWGMDDQGQPDKKLHKGQIVVDEVRVKDVQAIFETALRARMPIHSVKPISVYGWHDAESMKDNNTSGWNFRAVGSALTCPQGTSGSKHASLTPGTIAIDINTVTNPYCHSNGSCEPAGSHWNSSAPGTLTREHPVVRMATTPRGSTVTVSLCSEQATTWTCTPTPTPVQGLGWSWGGSWTSPDYQHLQYVGG